MKLNISPIRRVEYNVGDLAAKAAADAAANRAGKEVSGAGADAAADAAASAASKQASGAAATAAASAASKQASGAAAEGAGKQLSKKASGVVQEFSAKIRKQIADSKNMTKGITTKSDFMSKLGEAGTYSKKQLGEVWDKSKNFAKNNPKMAAAGISAAALGAYMLATGESNPGKAAGEMLGSAAETAAEAAGTGIAGGLEGLFKGLGFDVNLGGLGEGIKYFLLVFCCFLVVYLIYTRLT